MTDTNRVDRAKAFWKGAAEAGDARPGWHLMADFATHELADKDTELTRLTEENERLREALVEAESALSIDRPGMAMSILTDALAPQATEDALQQDLVFVRHVVGSAGSWVLAEDVEENESR